MIVTSHFGLAHTHLYLLNCNCRASFGGSVISTALLLYNCDGLVMSATDVVASDETFVTPTTAGLYNCDGGVIILVATGSSDETF